MTTRGTLATDLAAWTDRDDVATGEVFNSLLRMAEAEIKRRVRTREQETTVTLTLTGRVTALPSEFLRLRSITLDDSQTRYMEYLPPARLRESAYWDNTGSFADPTPQAYSIEGGNLLIAPEPAAEPPTTLSLTLSLIHISEPTRPY